jgi:hypothetical protein
VPVATRKRECVCVEREREIEREIGWQSGPA